MAVSRPKFGIGASALYYEDQPFVIGQGQYMQDIAITVSSTLTVVNAVIDALWRANDIRHNEIPATPLRVREAIQSSSGLILTFASR